MGNQFPGDSEYPDYRPLPSPAVEAVKPVTPLVLTASLGLTCVVPPHDDTSVDAHEHLPHHDFVEIRSMIAFGVGTSSSPGGDPMSWQNGSMFHAADVAIRNGYMRRDAFIRTIAGSVSSGLCGGLDIALIKRS